MTFDVVFQFADGSLSTSRWIVVIKKRDVIHCDRIRQTNTVLGLVRYLSQRQRSAGETVRERDHTVGGLIFLKGHLERIFVCHRAAGRQKTML